MSDEDGTVDRLSRSPYLRMSAVGQLASAIQADRANAQSLEQRIALLEEQLDRVLALLAEE
ncbi:MAG: hypothetical protein QOJ79_3608 [Actinomycetota bacterium]|nr:hypothetical protein [Actinomycetota bacterium]